MQSTRRIDRGGKHPNEDKITTKHLMLRIGFNLLIQHRSKTWTRSPLVYSSVASRAIPYLCALACGPLTSFPSRLRLESLLSKLRYFLVESLKICTLTLRSSGHLESCSSRVWTLVGLHDTARERGFSPGWRGV
jgi:hypothetical protein